jgi:hypothetical protein
MLLHDHTINQVLEINPDFRNIILDIQINSNTLYN